MRPAGFASVLLLAFLVAVAAAAQVEAYRLDVGGAANVRFRAQCRMVDKPDDRFSTFVGTTPASFDVSGQAVECTIAKLRGDGTIRIELRRGDGLVIASSLLTRRNDKVRVRSVGPWGPGGAKKMRAASGVPDRPPATVAQIAGDS